MKQNAFMKELKTALEGHMSEDELIDVLADYQEYFETGCAEGETEEEVAERLGHPARIALSLLNRKSESAEKEEMHAGENRTEHGQSRLSLPAPPLYARIAAIAFDILLAALPYLFLSPRLALSLFFTPQYLPMFLSSFISTIQISNHDWIASMRAFWLAGLYLSGIWWLFLNPLLLTVMKGQTLGKRLLGLRVVRPDGTGASPLQYFVREWFGKIALNMLLSMIWFPLSLLSAIASLILALVTKDGLTIWDALSGTRVTSSRRTEVPYGHANEKRDS